MDVIFAELQQVAVLVLFLPLMHLALWATGAALLLVLVEMLTYAMYRVLTRTGFLS